jgi:hypothetical protein
MNEPETVRLYRFPARATARLKRVNLKFSGCRSQIFSRASASW